jgi:hypothetical protein
MCFSNLPVEFDDDGNPKLVDTEDPAVHDHATDTAECAPTDDRLAPEQRYEEILTDLPDRARDRLEHDTNDSGPERQTLAE